MSNATPYTDLLLRIFPLEADSQAYPVEAEVSDGSRFTNGQLKLDQDALLRLQAEAEDYGKALFEALFAGDIRRAYDKATGIAEAESNGRLRLRLWVDNDAVELHAIAWERLYHIHKGHWVPLGASTLTPLSRYTSLEIREPQPITAVPLQMLVALSNPDKLPGGLAPANIELEVESLRRALDGLCRAGQVRVTLMPGHSGLSPALRAKLEGEGYTIVDGPLTLFNLAPQIAQTHIFHFIGHGAFKSGAGGGTAALYLEKVDGTWHAVRDEEIVNMFAALGTLPHLIFLVACESAKRTPGATSPFVGLGPKFVQAGVPAVVAMQEQVPVELARVLSSEFYARLAEHGEVDQALNQARLQVFNKKSTEWAIPALFMRIRKGRIFGADLDEDAPAPGEPPFKGMEYFTEDDAGKFYGRELLTARLAGKLRGTRFLPIIIGSSGSGKSSVIRAGLIPALKRGEPLVDDTLPPAGSEHWPVYILTPTTRPLEALAAALTRDELSVQATTALINDLDVDQRAVHQQVGKLLAERPTSKQLLLIVDQFEEIFTLCKDEHERRMFIDNLLYASAESTAGPTIVIIIFRADFYAHCAQYENLRVGVSTNQEFVGPMNAAELRRAIEEPAKATGWDYEPGLVDLILKEVGDEPGALPLMQHALLETWKRRRGRTMTLRGYNDAGGIRGAIAKTAEAIYTTLPPEHQPIARRIFLRLVELGEGTQDTRRRARLEELWPRAEQQPVAQSVLKKLVDNRLVVTTDKTAEVSHEALIREWPTLRQWIDESREGLRLHRELLTAAEDWEKVQRDEGALYRGVRLAQAQEWAANPENADELGRLEKEFIATSQAVSEREAREKEEQRQRELEAAQKIAEEQKRRAEEQARAAERQRRLARVIAGVAVVAFLAAIIAVFLGYQSQQNAVLAQNNESTAVFNGELANHNAATAVFNEKLAQDNAAQAAREARLAKGRELVAQADNALGRDPELSLMLGLQSLRVTAPDGVTLPAAEDMLHRALSEARLLRTMQANDEGVSQVVVSPDGKWIASASDDDTATIWNLETGEVVQTLSGHDDDVYSVAFSPDGKRLATGSLDHTAKIWDLATSAVLHTLSGHEDAVQSVAFSPDGQTLASASSDGTAKLWEVATGSEIATLAGHDVPLYNVAFSPDGQRLAAVGEEGVVVLWAVATGDQEFTLNVGDAFVNGVAFSPDGSLLATAHGDGAVRLWDAATGESFPASINHLDSVSGVTFSADGTSLATTSADATAKVWEVATGVLRFTLAGHSKEVLRSSFSPDGQRLVTSGRDGAIKLWDISPTSAQEIVTHPAHDNTVYQVRYTPDGTRFATVSLDGTARIWDTATGEAILTLTPEGDAPEVYALDFTPDGKQLVTSGCDSFDEEGNCLSGTVTVWDASSGEAVYTFTPHLNGVQGLAVSRDGKKLATASWDGTAKIWEFMSDRELASFSASDLLNRIAFSPDSSRVAFTTYAVNDNGVVWSFETGEAITLSGHIDQGFDVAFAPDGKRLASTSADGTAIIWEATTGQPVFTLSGHNGAVKGVAFSADSQYVATAGADQMVMVWLTATGERWLTLYGHADEVRGVAFSPDGTQLASVGADAAVRRYVLRLADLQNLVLARLTRWFSTAECEQFFAGEACPES